MRTETPEIPPLPLPAIEIPDHLEPLSYRDSFLVAVGGEYRVMLNTWWDAMGKNGPMPPKQFHSNDACTASPDGFRGYQLWPACFVHDFHYKPGSGVDSREHADNIFRRNIDVVLRLQGCGFFLRNALKWAYWYGVKRLGGPFYQ